MNGALLGAEHRLLVARQAGDVEDNVVVARHLLQARVERSQALEHLIVVIIAGEVAVHLAALLGREEDVNGLNVLMLFGEQVDGVRTAAVPVHGARPMIAARRRIEHDELVLRVQAVHTVQLGDVRHGVVQVQVAHVLEVVGLWHA